METKRIFQFKIINCPYKYVYSHSAGIDFRRQILTSKVDPSVRFGLSDHLILLSLKSRMSCVTCISNDNQHYFTDNFRVAIYYKRNCINKFCCKLLEILFICLPNAMFLSEYFS